MREQVLELNERAREIYKERRESSGAREPIPLNVLWCVQRVCTPTVRQISVANTRIQINFSYKTLFGGQPVQNFITIESKTFLNYISIPNTVLSKEYY